jgi:phosphate-selective porin OprO and OprP
MSGRSLSYATVVAIGTALATGSASAQSVTKEQIDALQAQIQSLQRELHAMKKKITRTEKAEERAEKSYAAAPRAPAKAPPPPPTAVAKMSSGNQPSICTPDGLNCIGITSRLHFDVGGYSYSPNTPATVPQNLDSGVNARRARIGVLGKFMGDWNYALIYDFGGSSDGFGGAVAGGGSSGIENAYLSYSGIKGMAIEGGYMDTPYTLDEATSSNDIMFLERASSQTIAAAIAAGDNRSTFGVRWFNDRAWLGAYVTGPTSGSNHSGLTTTEQYGGFGRAAFQLINNDYASLHIGGDAEFLFKPPYNNATNVQTLTLSDRPELRIDPTSILSTGAIANVSGAQVYSAEAAASYGPLFFQGEYFYYNVDRLGWTGLPSLHFDGGYAEASWVLTGESRKYKDGSGAYGGIVPANPVTPSGHGLSGWGAWEIAGRYSVVDLNDQLGTAAGAAGGTQTVYTAGLNWYPNRNIRFMLDYLHGIIDKQASATNPSDVGAKFDAVAMRTQIAF